MGKGRYGTVQEDVEVREKPAVQDEPAQILEKPEKGTESVQPKPEESTENVSEELEKSAGSAQTETKKALWTCRQNQT